MTLLGCRWETKIVAAPPVRGPPGLSARACHSHTRSEFPLKLRALETKPIRPVHVIPRAPAGRFHRHPPRSLPPRVGLGRSQWLLAKSGGRVRCAGPGAKLLPEVTLSSAPRANEGGERGACQGFRTGTEDSSPRTEAGTGELGLGSLGPERSMTLHFSERTWPPEVEKGQGLLTGAGSQGRNLKLKGSQRREEPWRSVHTTLCYSLGDSCPEGGVHLTQNNAKSSTGVNSHSSSYEETETRGTRVLAASHSQESGSRTRKHPVHSLSQGGTLAVRPES